MTRDYPIRNKHQPTKEGKDRPQKCETDMDISKTPGHLSMPLPSFCLSRTVVAIYPPFSGGQSDVSSSRSCSTRSQRGRGLPAHHRPGGVRVPMGRFKQENIGWYLLLELLVDSVQRILDGDALHIPSSHLQSQWEVQVNLLDGRIDQVHFEDVFVFEIWRRGVESPGMKSTHDRHGTSCIVMLKDIPPRLLRF